MKCIPLPVSFPLPIDHWQREAVMSANNALELVRGPPGTGKSTTIANLCYVHAQPASVSVVMALGADALDSATEKLVLAGHHVIAVQVSIYEAKNIIKQ